MRLPGIDLANSDEALPDQILAGIIEWYAFFATQTSPSRRGSFRLA
jgi:hypothetical protein